MGPDFSAGSKAVWVTLAPMAGHRRLWAVLRAACSISVLAWVLWRTPLHSFAGVMARASLPLIVIGLGLNVLTRLAAAERTQVICRGLRLRVSRWQNIETLFISNFYALLSPGPVLSGAVSVFRYSRFGIPLSEGLGVLLISRVIEAAAFIAIGTACLWADTRVPLAAVRYPLAAATAMLVLMALAMVIWRRTHRKPTSRAEVESNRVVSLFARRWMRPVVAVWREVMSRGPTMVWRAAIPAAVQVLMSGAALD